MNNSNPEKLFKAVFKVLLFPANTALVYGKEKAMIGDSMRRNTTNGKTILETLFLIILIAFCS